MRYQVHYVKDADFRCKPNLTKEEVTNGTTYAFIKETEANDLEDLFLQMQGEVWSPKGEARGLIQKAGVDHTSMSVGDVAIDEEGKAHQVAPLGWTDLREE